MNARRAALASLLTMVLCVFAVPSASADGGIEVHRRVLDLALEAKHVVGLAADDHGYVALASDGSLLRSSDAKKWKSLHTTGIDAGLVTGLAATDSELVAVGYDLHKNGEDYVFDPKVWRSIDGRTWKDLSPGVVEAGVEAEVEGVTVDGQGFLAFGSTFGGETEDYGRYVLPALWRSTDGTTWTLVDAPGLSNTDQYSVQTVDSFTLRGGEQLAVQETECADCEDDLVLELFAAKDGGAWAHVKATGLDAFAGANTDVIPEVVVVGHQYVALGVKGRDPKLSTYVSGDGVRWHGTHGASTHVSDTVDAALTDGRTAVALSLVQGKLVVWTITPM